MNFAQISDLNVMELNIDLTQKLHQVRSVKLRPSSICPNRFRIPRVVHGLVLAWLPGNESNDISVAAKCVSKNVCALQSCA